MSRRSNGALMSYGLVFVRLLVALIYTPILVSNLGQEAYGLFALVGALAAYLHILDFGMNDSVLRFFVTHANEPKTRDGFLSRMMLIYSLIGGLIALVTLGLASSLDQIFGANMTPTEINELYAMLLVTGTGAACLVAFNPVAALISAAERFVFLRGIELIGVILSTLISVILLKQGFGALAVVWVMTIGSVALVVLRLGFAIIALNVRLHLSSPDLGELRKVALYGAPILLSMIAEIIFRRIDAVLIGTILGAAPIAIYAIGVTFNKYFMSFATSLSRVMTPDIVRRIDAGADSGSITDLMIRISRIQALVLFLILGGLIVFGQRFLNLWLGPEYSLSYWIMLLVLVPYALELTGNVRNIVLQVRQLYWYKAAISLAMALLNIPITIFLLSVWGIIGAAAGTGIAIILGYFLIALLLQQRVGVGMLRYWRETARGILPLAIVTVVLGLLCEPFLPSGWGWLILGVIIFSMFYTGAMACFAVNAEENILFQRVFDKLRLRRRPGA